MSFSFFSALGAVLAVSISISLAESRIPDVPSDPPLRPVSGSLKAGYSTNYEFRGLIPGGCNPTAPLRLDWRKEKLPIKAGTKIRPLFLFRPVMA